MNGIPKGLCPFGGVTPHKMGRCREATEGTYLLGQRQRLWWGWGKLNKPVPFVAVRHLPTLWGVTPQLQSPSQRVNFQTVRWTVWKEGTPCKRRRSLKGTSRTPSPTNACYDVAFVSTAVSASSWDFPKSSFKIIGVTMLDTIMSSITAVK